ncbi:sulfurtransferase complex subunit TusB [Marinobacterium sediminicola]|uniref:tRNA 2-thiouridine synthesizing protein B n=1 Tax=Marinobacterium sediminicola TaxID=518898 RepID=A0ABY1RXS1_9GAMM|nr:sulfurtransferase complex subunit TusB [Marinobacterium sediminicola]ULG70763.1 sulfurtransferase complex subunit TusB [Marinobacterium sediminicola]SMR71662.1 tRNA 2-thiouridine synthesizing protein B [Marinobacterium sediminicola]
MTLHILNTSPSDRNTFLTCALALAEDDTLLLIEDGTYWLLPQHRSELARVPARVVALAPDRLARGVVVDNMTEVDDAGFVELTVQHDRIVSWF